MTEIEMRQRMRKLKRQELMLLLASYILSERGVITPTEKQITEIIAENYMENVAIEDLRTEIITTRERLCQKTSR